MAFRDQILFCALSVTVASISFAQESEVREARSHEIVLPIRAAEPLEDPHERPRSSIKAIGLTRLIIDMSELSPGNPRAAVLPVIIPGDDVKILHAPEPRWIECASMEPSQSIKSKYVQCIISVSVEKRAPDGLLETDTSNTRFVGGVATGELPEVGKFGARATKEVTSLAKREVRPERVITNSWTLRVWLKNACGARTSQSSENVDTSYEVQVNDISPGDAPAVETSGSIPTKCVDLSSAVSRSFPQPIKTREPRTHEGIEASIIGLTPLPLPPPGHKIGPRYRKDPIGRVRFSIKMSEPLPGVPRAAVLPVIVPDENVKVIRAPSPEWMECELMEPSNQIKSKYAQCVVTVALEKTMPSGLLKTEDSETTVAGVDVTGEIPDVGWLDGQVNTGTVRFVKREIQPERVTTGSWVLRIWFRNACEAISFQSSENAGPAYEFYVDAADPSPDKLRKYTSELIMLQGSIKKHNSGLVSTRCLINDAQTLGLEARTSAAKAELTYPGDCKDQKLREAAMRNECTLGPRGGYNMVMKNGRIITRIPHSVKPNGTCRSIIKALNEHC